MTIARLAIVLFAGLASALALAAGARYAGSAWIYVLFTVAANALLLNGFRRRALFFDTFIGLFFWLGFWLKFSLRVAFASGVFYDSVGAFDGSGEAFDHALLVSSSGFSAVLLASFVRDRLFRYPEQTPDIGRSGLFRLYSSNRWLILVAFLSFAALVALSNIWLGIYQRGMVAQTVLPYGLNGIYAWLLQFGLASGSALIIRFELELYRNVPRTAVFVPLLESFMSSVSLFSRGMVLNASALALGALRVIQSMRRSPTVGMIALAASVFAVLFALSVVSVNYLRAASSAGSEHATMDVVQNMTTPLFIDRWVGIEGVMAISSSDRLGWDLWKEAWQEEFKEGELSLFDREFIDSPYKRWEFDKPRFHSVSLPGLVAFLYYPGSLAFLFVAVLAFAWFAAALEIAAYRFCGRNLVLCALFGQVIAFRYASFGYVPAQSYLLFGALVLNGMMIFAADVALRRYYCLPR